MYRYAVVENILNNPQIKQSLFGTGFLGRKRKSGWKIGVY